MNTFLAGEMIICLYPHGQKNLTQSRAYRVEVSSVIMSESRVPAVKIIDDSGEYSWYYTWRFTHHQPMFKQETYEDQRG